MVAAGKGGCGKTTLSVHLAVLAGDAVLVDADPQRSAAAWHHRRADSEAAVKFSAGTVRDLPYLQDRARGAGVRWLVVDTAPRTDQAALAKLADFIVIPCRPGILDLDAIGDTVRVIAASGKPAAVVFNSCPPGRAGHEAGIVGEARAALKDSPVKAAPQSIGQRASFAHALITGRAVTEFEPTGKAALELQNLWTWIGDHVG